MITSLIILLGYLIYVVAKFGIPTSISETFYLLGKKGWMFQVALFLVAFSVMPTLIDKSSEDTQFLAFLSCAGLIFVGAAPFFKRAFDSKVHFISAAICCVGLVLWQIFNACWITPLVCLLAVLYPMYKDRKYMCWLEIATIVSAYVSLILFS